MAVRRSASTEIAKFVGQVNLIEARVPRSAGADHVAVATEFGELEIPAGGSLAEGSLLTLALRPEAVEIAAAAGEGPGIPATVLSS